MTNQPPQRDGQDDGGPAFPHIADIPIVDAEGAVRAWSSEYADACKPGMSLRDYFAAKADVAAYNPTQSFRMAHKKLPTIDELADYIATIRFIEADAMLSARQPQQAQEGE